MIWLYFLSVLALIQLSEELSVLSTKALFLYCKCLLRIWTFIFKFFCVKVTTDKSCFIYFILLVHLSFRVYIHIPLDSLTIRYTSYANPFYCTTWVKNVPIFISYVISCIAECIFAISFETNLFHNHY